MKRFFACTAVLVASLLVPTAQAAVTATDVIAVGDIAVSGGAQGSTAQIAENFNPEKVLLLGDLAYQQGSDRDFSNYFLPYWSQFMDRAWAVPGNHEYYTSNAQGYRNLASRYSLPTTGSRLWWVRTLDRWTVIGLDSEAVGGATGQAQVAFLKSALKAHNGRPTIVTWHRPTFSRGEHGDQFDTADLWTAASADPDVKLVLWGHDHNYEQLNTRLGSGKSAHTVTSIVVGTGGAELRGCSAENVAGELICGSNNYGVLKLVLKAKSFAWSYRQVDGSAHGLERDRGSRTW